MLITSSKYKVEAVIVGCASHCPKSFQTPKFLPARSHWPDTVTVRNTTLGGARCGRTKVVHEKF